MRRSLQVRLKQPPALLLAWWRADDAARKELLQMLLSVAIGLAVALSSGKR